MATAQNINNGGIVGGDGDDMTVSTHIGAVGAHLDQLCDPNGGLRVHDVFDHERGSALVGWHLKTMQHGDTAFFGSHADPNNPPLADLLVVPTTSMVPDLGPLIAEALAARGIEVPDRAACLAWDEADRAAGGLGGDPDIEWMYASYCFDPELTSSPAEKRICGVPESVYNALEPDEQAKVAAGKVIASPNAPTAVAAWVLHNHLTARDLLPGQSGRRQRRLVPMRKLTRIGETWFHYTTPAEGGPPRWVARTNSEWMRGRLREVLRGMSYVKMRKPDDPVYELKPWPSKVNDLREVEAALADLVSIDADTSTGARELPDAYGRRRNVYPATGTWVLCRNGVLDVNTGQHVPNTPLWFSLTRVEANYDHRLDPYADTLWSRLLRAQWGDDPGSMTRLQQWFGYVVSGRNDLQKFLWLYGVPGSGKTTMTLVLKALMGTVSEVGLDALNERFGLEEVYLSGSTLALISDSRFSSRDSSLAVNRLIAITGGDPLRADIKHKSPVTSVLPVRIHGTSNSLPNLSDHTGALMDRILLLKTSRAIRDTGEDVKNAAGKVIATELAYVLRWAVEGLASLNAAGAQFTRPRGDAEERDDLDGELSNVLSFVRECCTIGEPKDDSVTPTRGDYVDRAALFRVWDEWSRVNKTGKHMSMKSFATAVTGLPGYSIKAGQRAATDEAKAQRVVWGLKRADYEWSERTPGSGVEVMRTAVATANPQTVKDPYSVG